MIIVNIQNNEFQLIERELDLVCTQVLVEHHPNDLRVLTSWTVVGGRDDGKFANTAWLSIGGPEVAHLNTVLKVEHANKWVGERIRATVVGPLICVKTAIAMPNSADAEPPCVRRETKVFYPRTVLNVSGTAASCCRVTRYEPSGEEKVVFKIEPLYREKPGPAKRITIADLFDEYGDLYDVAEIARWVTSPWPTEAAP